MEWTKFKGQLKLIIEVSKLYISHKIDCKYIYIKSTGRLFKFPVKLYVCLNLSITLT